MKAEIMTFSPRLDGTSPPEKTDAAMLRSEGNAAGSFSGNGDKMIGKVLINLVVSHLVGIGYGGSRNLTTESDVIKLLVI
jgi:hypothetical protein